MGTDKKAFAPTFNQLVPPLATIADQGQTSDIYTWHGTRKEQGEYTTEQKVRWTKRSEIKKAMLYDAFWSFRVQLDLKSSTNEPENIVQQPRSFLVICNGAKLCPYFCL